METSKPKPDMMAASPTPGGGKRILAQLEHGARPAAKPARASSWSIDGWTVGLGLLLLLMAGVAWMMHEKKITPSTYKHGESRSRPIAATPRAEVPATAAAEQPAAIVNESPLAYAAPPATTSDTPHPPAQPSRYSTNVGAIPATRTPATAVAQRTPRNASGAATDAPAVRDTDIVLLTALVAHASKPTITVAERSRDVVERQDGDTTAQLLARCQQLGLIEGMLCRSRICSGRWEADAACRAPSH